jgi:hypothetical protein
MEAGQKYEHTKAPTMLVKFKNQNLKTISLIQ